MLWLSVTGQSLGSGLATPAVAARAPERTITCTTVGDQKRARRWSAATSGLDLIHIESASRYLAELQSTAADWGAALSPSIAAPAEVV